MPSVDAGLALEPRQLEAALEAFARTSPPTASISTSTLFAVDLEPAADRLHAQRPAGKVECGVALDLVDLNFSAPGSQLDDVDRVGAEAAARNVPRALR